MSYLLDKLPNGILNNKSIIKQQTINPSNPDKGN